MATYILPHGFYKQTLSTGTFLLPMRGMSIKEADPSVPAAPTGIPKLLGSGSSIMPVNQLISAG